MRSKIKLNLLFTLSSVLIFASSCISGTKVKSLGRGTLNIVKPDTATSSTFKFDFAFRESTSATTVYLRGIANTKNVMIATCNSTGSRCTCDYFNNAGTQLTPSSTIQVSYNELGNFFMCSNGGITTTDIASVRIRTLTSSKISETLTVKTSLTINEIMGDLDVNRVRGVFRYRCIWTFLQKLGTSSSGFSCTDKSAANQNCGDKFLNDGVTTYQGDLCFLKVQYPYFLFRDANLNNFSLKGTDAIYSQVGSCFPMLKRFDCTASQQFGPSDSSESGVTPTAVLGIMADQVGVYENPVSFQASPTVSETAYGFAAATISFNALTICPPGLAKFQFYSATPDTGFTAFPPQGTSLDAAANHNFPSTLTAKNVDSEPQTAETSSTGVPGPLQVIKIVGLSGSNANPPNPFTGGDTGDCATSGSSTACQFPNSRQTTNAAGATNTGGGVSQVKQWATSGSVFCAIPAAKVPNIVGGG